MSAKVDTTCVARWTLRGGTGPKAISLLHVPELTWILFLRILDAHDCVALLDALE
jgi:hypothetical protein